MPLKKGDLLTDAQLGEAVYELVVHALDIGMIPIAGIMSRRNPSGLHEVLGFGWNHLREGLPGIHGETGAVMNMGRIEDGYADLTATSSLSPCPFCQATLARHMGVREIRICDATNYKPDFSGYKTAGLEPVIAEHKGIIELFGKWVRDPANALIWARDIGEFDHPTPRVFDVNVNRARVDSLMRMANAQAERASDSGENPAVGAVIIDSFGEVLGAGHTRIIANNDPSAVASMVAWRACGSRDHWRDKTLILSAGPDPIATSMFEVFRFGQLVVAEVGADRTEIERVRSRGVPTHLWT